MKTAAADAYHFRPDINVSIETVDESGARLPYVTVWRFFGPGGRLGELAGPMTLDDLWRITQRYSDSFDFATYFYNPIPLLLVPRMTDNEGKSLDEIDYKDETGQTRGAQVTIGYSFMKRGYLPEKAQIVAGRNDKRFALKVVLKRDPKVTLEKKDYLDTFDRLRWELSDWRQNKSLTPANRERLTRLWNELETTAEAALRAGDRHSAARIYAYLQHVPQMEIRNGQPAFVYGEGLPDAPRQVAALAKANELDPTDTYIWMRRVMLKAYAFNDFTLDKASETPERKQAFLDQVKETERLVAERGEWLWPEVYRVLINYYKRARWYDKAYALIKRMESFEPRYEDYAKLMKSLKTNMELHNVPVPSDWK